MIKLFVIVKHAYPHKYSFHSRLEFSSLVYTNIVLSFSVQYHVIAVEGSAIREISTPDVLLTKSYRSHHNTLCGIS